MAFQTPITIQKAIENIDQRKYYLPSIQREFVWKPEQIERLFDSIMKGYPIGSFLFWLVEDESIEEYQFYEFIRDFHEKNNRHNPKANLVDTNSIIAILDGQQRLTSLYIGLKGSYAEKLPYKKWKYEKSFEKKELYLNLLNESQNIDYTYDFKFWSKKDLSKLDDRHYWFKVGEILKFKSVNDIFKYVKEHHIENAYATECLSLLYEQIMRNKAVNYYLEEGQELDKVLNIFIRVNSGGTQLSYSDLLLSIATAQWTEEDAREAITLFVDEINNIGDTFDFNKDIVLKTCLVLIDLNDIAFKVDNFNSTNMKKIEAEWENISDAIRLAVELVSSLGFNYKTLTANYVIIPIAYYLYKKGNPKNFVDSNDFIEDRRNIKKFITVALLKRIFGGQPDNVLKPIREMIKSNLTKFPYDTIKNNLKITNKSMKFTEEEMEDLLNYKYGKKYTFSVLSLLYPTLDYKNLFHQDHIFPKSLMKSRTKLRKKGLSEEEIQFCIDNHNNIPNLQLIEGIPNQEKSNEEFEKWFHRIYKTDEEKQNYRNKHYIPDVNLSVSEFRAFIEERERLLLAKLKKVLLD